MRVLINGGEVICHVWGASGFHRLKTTGNSLSSEGLVLDSYPPKEALALLPQEAFSIWFGDIGYWPITHKIMALLFWMQGIRPWLCLQHLYPSHQFLLSLSLQMPISFCKGQTVVSSSRWFWEKQLRTMPSFSNTNISQNSSVVLWLQPFPASLSKPHQPGIINEPIISVCGWHWKQTQFQTTQMSDRSTKEG